jgi:anti-sigma factor RsiW
MSAVAAPLDLTCKEFVEVITEYLDGTLPPADAARVERHLAGCDGCRAYLSQMRRTIRIACALGDRPAEPVADATRRRLLDAFREWKGAARPAPPPDSSGAGRR